MIMGDNYGELDTETGIYTNFEDEARQQLSVCEHDWQYYDGCLGYESLKCSKCHIDINDFKEK
jgi:hypothetical protein